MKQFGLTGSIKGWPNKIDYHCHHSNRKIGSWWYDCNCIRKRGWLKQTIQKEIKTQIQNENL